MACYGNAVAQVDHQWREQISRHQAVFSDRDDGETGDIVPNMGLPRWIESEHIQIFAGDGQPIAGIDRENRQGDKTQTGRAQALDKHERPVQRAVDENEFAFLLKARQPVRQGVSRCLRCNPELRSTGCGTQACPVAPFCVSFVAGAGLFGTLRLAGGLSPPPAGAPARLVPVPRAFRPG